MSTRKFPVDAAQLRRSIHWALEQGFTPKELTFMARELADLAPQGSSNWLYAQELLALTEVHVSPWRAALASRRLLQHAPLRSDAHASLGLALSLLGHPRAAIRAYRRAILLGEHGAVVHHNLGHLLDLHHGPSQEAVSLLRKAYHLNPHVEIATSLAHALARCGGVQEAQRVLEQALRGSPPEPHHQALQQWISSIRTS